MCKEEGSLSQETDGLFMFWNGGSPFKQWTSSYHPRDEGEGVLLLASSRWGQGHPTVSRNSPLSDLPPVSVVL